MTFSIRNITETSQLSMDPWEASNCLARLAMTRLSTFTLNLYKMLVSIPSQRPIVLFHLSDDRPGSGEGCFLKHDQTVKQSHPFLLR